MTVLSTRPMASIRQAESLAYATYGRGAPLLLIHDVGESGNVWLPFIRPLATHYCLIVPDLRGHGRSADLPRAESLGALVDDLRHLLDTIELSPCVVIGHGAGGAIAARLARDEPERVRAMALLRACRPSRFAALRRRVQGWLPLSKVGAQPLVIDIPVSEPLHHQVTPVCAALVPWLEQIDLAADV